MSEKEEHRSVYTLDEAEAKAVDAVIEAYLDNADFSGDTGSFVKKVVTDIQESIKESLEEVS